MTVIFAIFFLIFGVWGGLVLIIDRVFSWALLLALLNLVALISIALRDKKKKNIDELEIENLKLQNEKLKEELSKK